MSSHSQLHGASFAHLLVRSAKVGGPLVGVLILIGWAWDVTALKSLVSGLPIVAPNTALALILAGVALGLLHPRAPSSRLLVAGRACGWGLILIGGLSLFQRAFAPNLGFQNLFFQWAGWAAVSPLPLTAPTSAICLVLLGLSLLLLGRRAPYPAWLLDISVALAMFVALFSFNSNFHYALNLLEEPQPAIAKGMSLHTALTFILLGVGILCARPEQGLIGQLTRDTLGGFLARWLVPVSVFGPTLVAVVLEVLFAEDFFSVPATAAIFSTVMSLSGVAMVLLSAHALNRIDAERERYLNGLQVARKEAERERALLQAVVEHAPVGILFAGPSTNEVRINSTLQSMLGFQLDPAAGRGQYLDRLRHMDGKPVLFEELPSTRALEGHEVPPEKFAILREKGPLPVLASAAPVRSPTGEVRGVIVCIQDISAQEELDRLREEYVGLISHDLRTPLQNISLRCQLLLRSLQEKGLASEVASTEALLRNARRMSGMVEELLESSRLEAGQVELHFEPLDMIHFLEEIIERDVPPDARERLRLEVAAPVPRIPADAARLERVLVNLLTNALKYSLPGTPVVVRLEREEALMRISVKDQGKGLTPEECERLFTKYYRTSAGKGTSGVGLGLYISRLIIEAHGGHIHVESTPGQGSTFVFTLPFTTPASSMAPQAMPAPNGGSTAQPS
ncbi:MAG TPA: ATP-binding protein [Hyalangium sp.]|nr:ATP-binding protein [Hyalangium sp.]